jgi:UDP-glucose 4-epimerase
VNVLVTGASGYVGERLCLALSDDPAVERVYAVVRGAAAPSHPRVVPITADLAETGWTRALPERVDAVAHLAQSRRYREFPNGAPDMFRINTASTLELLEWTRSAGGGRFVFTSTGNVYRPVPHPLHEDDACGPAGFYGASKLSAELLAEPYGALMGVTVLRLFGVYGPGQSGMLISGIVDRVLDGMEVVLTGGAGLYLTPLYVDDCVEALSRCLVRPAAPGLERFNLAGDEAVSLADVVRMVEEATGRRARISAPTGDIAYLMGDASAARAALGWRPRVPLRVGLERVLAARAPA